MPADIMGTNIVMEDQASGRRRFEFQRGPIFGQIILADEINRATPKTQSAMLEAMQEHSVTSGGEVRKLPEPFIVLATQNPIEQEGTYPLPEAQLDRFFFKLLVPYSNRQELRGIIERTTTGADPQAGAVLNAEQILQAQELVRHVVIAEHVQDYAIRLVLATHPQGEFAAETTNRFVRFGASPRGVQALVLSGKVRAMLDERYHVSFSDIEASVLPALRHRLLLNFEGQAEGVTTDEVLKQILQTTPRALEQKLDVP
jgi:MoxR-like ATPase